MPHPTDLKERERLENIYNSLRDKLLDLSRRNQLLNYNLRPNSKRFLQLVGCSLEDAFRRLVLDESTLKINELTEPDSIPPDERTDEFRSAIDRAKTSDVEYQTELEAALATGRDDEVALGKMERKLRDRVRAELEMPPLQTRKEINRIEHAKSVGIDPSLELGPRGTVNDRGLQTLKFPDELESLLEKISADARLAEQEMGLSTLFLAFGFLEWYDAESSEKKAFAPLLLIPVEISKQKVGKPVYSLSVRDGEAEANLSLQKLLQQKFGRAIPDFTSDEDDTTVSVEGYLNSVKKAIENLPRWQVRRWLVLGHFSFGRFAMYADLEPEKWKNHLGHPLVGSILKGVEQGDNGSGLLGVPDDYEIDKPEFERIAPFLIHDADASQHSALVDVMKGSNLVVQGPPGTGKSQTITNAIANALAAGRRVLFLADKSAALRVVKKRLDQAGLGEFCLELHSDKASSKLIIESIRLRHEMRTERELAAQPDLNWQRSRQEITYYVKALNAEDVTGTTPFDLIWKAIRGRSKTDDVAGTLKDLIFPEDLTSDRAKFAEASGDLWHYTRAAIAFEEAYGHPGRSPWASVPFSNFPRYEAPRFVHALRELRKQALETADTISRYVDIGVVDIASFSNVARVAAGLPTAVDFELEHLDRANLDDLRESLEIRGELLRTEGDLAALADLRGEDPERLAIGAAHLRTSASTSFLDHTPDAAYALAKTEIAILEVLARLIEPMIAPLAILGPGGDLSAKQLPAAAAAAYVLGAAPAGARRWIVQLPHTSKDDVDTAAIQLRGLRQAETTWLQKARGYRSDARPQPSALFAAAQTLRKTGLTKIFASIGGATNVARALASELGIEASAEIMEELAAHVSRVQTFEQNETNSVLFGAAWAGLNTRADEIREGLKLRDLMLNVITRHGGDLQIVECALTASPETMEQLGAHCDASKSVLSLSNELKGRLRDEPTDQFLADLRERVNELRAFLAVDPGTWLAGLETPIRRIAHAHDVLGRLRRLSEALSARETGPLAFRIATDRESLKTARNAIGWTAAVKSSGLSALVKARLLSARAVEFFEKFRQAAVDHAQVETNIGIARAALLEFGAQAFGEIGLRDIVSQVDQLDDGENQLPDFITLRELRGRLEQHGLKSFLDICDELIIDPARLPELFEAMVVQRSAAARRKSQALRPFTGTTLDGHRETFRRLDRHKIVSDRAVIRSKLLQVTPPIGFADGPRKSWTEMRLLRNEFTKQRRFTPVRQVLGRAGRAIQSLKPCFMMSPLSLAKFVPAGILEFDLLVIDEASQMRPQDALGGLLRAKQIVVVGDAKQLPPSDFFAREDAPANDSDDTDDEDSESILESCEKTFGLRRRLKWHYRSRCESLIAFSNSEFYDNGLITFPMARPGSFSIELIRVDGAYRRGRNPAEARRVAEEAVAFMRHSANVANQDLTTLGIAAINSDQRDMIEDELRLLCAEDALVETYMERVKEKGEEFFVKNLENVQGDERDHIFISMTYGKKSGEPSLSQNFGPINRSQGHRRLNVLFTRARIRIGLFASFGSADVQMKDGKPGVNALHGYLAYAESQGRAFAHAPTGAPDSDFEVEVADRLRARGYVVDLQVGVSRREQRGRNFRIDLGVHHPDMPGHYLAGVECDGAAYHASKSARDRDRLREEVLNNLGWSLVRVWSTDWFDDPSRETNRLVMRLEALRSQPPPTIGNYPSLNRGAPAVETVPVPSVGTQSDKPTSEHTSPSNEDISAAKRKSEAKALLEGQGKLTQAQAAAVLVYLRDFVIAPAMEDWEPERSLLRPGMIETFVKQRISDPQDWLKRIPRYLREGTHPIEKKRYLETVCDVIDRLPK